MIFGRTEVDTLRFAQATLLAIAWSMSAPDANAAEMCFQTWINRSTHQDLWLRADHSYESVNYDGASVDWRDHGRWVQGEGNEITFLSFENVRGVQTKTLHVSVHLKSNLELLPQLRDVVSDFLRRYPHAEFAEQQIRDELMVLGESCRPEHEYICTGGCGGGQSRHFVNVSANDPIRPAVRRSELSELLSAIDEYELDGTKHKFRATLVRVGGRTSLAMHDYGAGWAWQPEDPDELRNRLRDRIRDERRGFAVSLGIEGGDGTLSLVPCSRLGPQ